MSHPDLLNSPLKYVSKNTSINRQLTLFVDGIETKASLLNISPALRPRLKVSDEVGPLFHNPYIEIGLNGQSNLGKYFQPLHTNGTRTIRVARGGVYPKGRKSNRPHANELNEADLKFLSERSEDGNLWQVPVEILIDALVRIPGLVSIQVGNVVSYYYLRLQAVEFYFEVPLSANLQETFDNTVRLISQHLKEPIEVISNVQRHRLQATFKIPLSSALRKLAKNWTAQFYLKERSFRFELKITGVKLGRREKPKDLSPDFQRLHDMAYELMAPIHESLLLPADLRASPTDLWDVLKSPRFHYRGQISHRDEFKILVERLAKYGVYTPSLFGKLTISRSALAKLSEPKFGIFERKLSPNGKTPFYVLRKDWNRKVESES